MFNWTFSSLFFTPKFTAEERAAWAIFPPVAAEEVGPNRAKDSAQPVSKVNPINKPKIFFILPF